MSSSVTTLSSSKEILSKRGFLFEPDFSSKTGGISEVRVIMSSGLLLLGIP
jgi:hypothetical protein